jgi:hypothetical protein
MLKSVYFDGPECDFRLSRTVHFYGVSREDLIAEWVARVDDPSYPVVLEKMRRLAENDPTERIRKLAQRFVDYHPILGTTALRRDLFVNPTDDGWHYIHNYAR